MKAFKDGDQWCIVEDDFINLQESPCEFVPVDSMMGRLIEHFETWKKGEVVNVPLVRVPPFTGIGEMSTVANTTAPKGWLII